MANALLCDNGISHVYVDADKERRDGIHSGLVGGVHQNQLATISL